MHPPFRCGRTVVVLESLDHVVGHVERFPKELGTDEPLTSQHGSAELVWFNKRDEVVDEVRSGLVASDSCQNLLLGPQSGDVAFPQNERFDASKLGAAHERRVHHSVDVDDLCCPLAFRGGHGVGVIVLARRCNLRPD